MQLGKLIVFNLGKLVYLGKWLYFSQKLLYLGKSGCIWAQVVLFEHMVVFAQNGSIYTKLLYLRKMVLFAQNGCVWENVAVFVQKVGLEQNCCIWPKKGVLGILMYQRHSNLCLSCNVDVSAPQESLSFLDYLCISVTGFFVLLGILMYQFHRNLCPS